MILFVNFAPIQFMGGAEKWMYEVAKFLNKSEQIAMVSVSQRISNIYSRIVLGRDFNKRVSLGDTGINLYSLGYKSFIPFSRTYKEIQNKFRNSRKIYIKYEINEIFIILYFGGFSIFKKTVFGIHSPFNYEVPLSFFEKLHNLLYLSGLSRFILSKAKHIHVITPRDESLFKNKFKLDNVIYIPTSVNMEIEEKPSVVKTGGKVNVVFVGDLSPRKGIDILCEVIDKSPSNIEFDIAGDGPLKEIVLSTVNGNDNARYHDFLNKSELFNLYMKADLLLLPSYAEGFPLVFHEAMAHGLLIVNSPHIAIGLPDFVEITADDNSSEEYIRIINSIDVGCINKSKIVNYYIENFESGKIHEAVSSYLFSKL